jgi:hypothetical protein
MTGQFAGDGNNQWNRKRSSLQLNSDSCCSDSSDTPIRTTSSLSVAQLIHPGSSPDDNSDDPVVQSRPCWPDKIVRHPFHQSSVPDIDRAATINNNINNRTSNIIISNGSPNLVTNGSHALGGGSDSSQFNSKSSRNRSPLTTNHQFLQHFTHSRSDSTAGPVGGLMPSGRFMEASGHQFPQFGNGGVDGFHNTSVPTWRSEGSNGIYRKGSNEWCTPETISRTPQKSYSDGNFKPPSSQPYWIPAAQDAASNAGLFPTRLQTENRQSFEAPYPSGASSVDIVTSSAFAPDPRLRVNQNLYLQQLCQKFQRQEQKTPISSTIAIGHGMPVEESLVTMVDVDSQAKEGPSRSLTATVLPSTDTVSEKYPEILFSDSRYALRSPYHLLLHSILMV